MADTETNDIFTRRICLQLEGMEAVRVDRDLVYGRADRDRRFDIYYPPGNAPDRSWPAVVIAAGYPGSMEPRPTPLPFKEFGWTVSMCQLIAASGLAAIAYTNREPAGDLQMLLDHLHNDAASLQIDSARIGIVGMSGNGPVALTTIMQDAQRPPACAVFGYAFLLDLDGRTEVADAARHFGFANPGAGRTAADIRRDVPMLIVRAGRDQFPGVNASIDRFIPAGLAANLPMTFVNHAEGPHAFDLFEDSTASRDAVRLALAFLRQRLAL